MNPAGTRRRIWTGLLAGAIFFTLAWVAAPRISREITFAPAEVGLKDPNCLAWTPATWTVRSGSDDPHFELVLPWWSRPVTELTFAIEPIWGNVGRFQFYYLPVQPDQPYFQDDLRVDVDAQIYGPSTLKVVFPPVAVDRVRFDPPDKAQFILKSVVARAWPGRQPAVRATLLWLALSLWFAVLAVRCWSVCGAAAAWIAARPAWVARVLLLVLVLARVGLTATQPLKAAGGALHDDQHFIEQAESIAHGHWLGDYNHFTLIKGQGYPLWIAAMYRLGMPLVFSQHLLYAAAVVLAFAAWRPVLSRAWRLAIVAVVLFNPASYHGDDAARVLRNHFSASLAILVFMCVTGWFLRWREPARRQVAWAAGAGGAFAALWLTREETIWITGVIGLVLLAGVWAVRRDGLNVWRRIAWVALAPVSLAAAMVAVVCAVNYSHYGFWGTVEFRAAPYMDAYGALARIKVGRWRQFVPVTREMREAAYKVSPTFARLQPILEGQLGVGWASLGTWQTGVPASERQIHGAAFMWALRDAAAVAGEHQNCQRAMNFYRHMADEINAACDDGRLPAYGRRSGFVPPWRPEYTAQLPGTYFEAWRFVTTFAYVVPKPPPSTGWESSLKVYREMALTPLSPRAEDPPLPPDRLGLRAFNNGVLKDITRIYADVTPFAVIAAVPLLGVLWWRVRRGRAHYGVAVLATVALAGAGAITLVVTLVEITSFVAITIGYQAAAYPFMLLFVVVTAAGLGQSFLPERARPAA